MSNVSYLKKFKSWRMDVVDYHNRAKILFSTRYDKVFQSPFFLKDQHYQNLLTSVKFYYDFLQKKYPGQSFFLARPEFIFDGTHFRLIDLNVSTSISAYSYTSCLRYFQNHPLNPLKDIDVSNFDFDFNLANEITQELNKRQAKSLLILDDHAPTESNYTEPIHHVSRLQSLGVHVKTANMRYANIRVEKDFILYNGVKFDKAILGFPPKHARHDWLLDRIEAMKKNRLLLANPDIEYDMMSKKNLVGFYQKYKKYNCAIRAITVSTPDDLQKIIQSKDSWVAKEVQGSNSKEVHIGPEMTKAQWTRHLNSIDSYDKWVFQKFETSKIWTMPLIFKNELFFSNFHPVFSPFIINGRICGVLVKAYAKFGKKIESIPGVAIPG